MGPKKKRKTLPSTMESSGEYNDSDEGNLDSVFEAARNVKMKSPIYMYTIKTKEPGLTAVDVKEFSDIVYSACYSSEIHVMSCIESAVSKKEYNNKKRCFNPEMENFECFQKFKEVRVLKHLADVTALSYTNGHLFLSCCLDGTVKAWNRNYQPVCSFSDVRKALSDIHSSPRMDYFATSSLAGPNFGTSLFSYSRNYPIMSLLGHTAGTQCVRFHYNGMYLATASEDNTIKMWSTQNSIPVRTFQDESQWYSHCKKLAFSPDGKYLASTYYGSVKIWDIASGRLIKTLGNADPSHIMYNICYSKCGKELAAGGSDGVLKVWKIEDYTLESSVENSDVDPLKYVLNKQVHKIQCMNNIYFCVSIE